MSPPPSSRDWPARSRPLSRPLARTGLGERDSFAALYARSSPHLFAVALGICGEPALAEAVLQDVYVHVWRAAGIFDPAQADPLAWLTHLVRERAIERAARARAHAVARPLVAGEPAARPATLPPGLAPGLDELAAAERDAFALALLQGLDAAGLAQRLGQPPGTVRRGVRRALQALARGLAEAAPEKRPASAGVR